MLQVEPSRGVDPIVNAPGQPTGQVVNGPNEIDLRDYFYDRSRYGLGGTLDYKLGPASSAFLHGLYSYFDDFGENGIYSLQTVNFLSPTLTDDQASTRYADNYRCSVQQIFSFNAGAHQEFSKSTLNYRAAFSEAKLTGGSDVRVAYSIGLARPSYGDLAPYILYDPSQSGTANPKLSAGKPSLN